MRNKGVNRAFSKRARLTAHFRFSHAKWTQPLAGGGGRLKMRTSLEEELVSDRGKGREEEELVSDRGKGRQEEEEQQQQQQQEEEEGPMEQGPMEQGPMEVL